MRCWRCGDAMRWIGARISAAGRPPNRWKPGRRRSSLAHRAAHAVRASLVGVDILTGCDGQDYVLEVNAVPGWKAVARCHQIDVARMVLDWLVQQIDSRSTEKGPTKLDGSADETPVRSSKGIP